MQSFPCYHHLAVGFCGWLLPLSTMFSRFIHVVAGIITLFLFMTAYYSIVWIYHNLFIHSSVNGHLCYFHLLAIVNDAAVDIHVHVSVCPYVSISLGYISMSGIARTYGNTMFNFWGVYSLFLWWQLFVVYLLPPQTWYSVAVKSMTLVMNCRLHILPSRFTSWEILGDLFNSVAHFPEVGLVGCCAD